MSRHANPVTHNHAGDPDKASPARLSFVALRRTIVWVRAHKLVTPSPAAGVLALRSIIIQVVVAVVLKSFSTIFVALNPQLQHRQVNKENER